MTQFENSLVVVQDGQQLRNIEETLTAAKWWVVIVHSEGHPMRCVYGGNAGSILRSLRLHAECSIVTEAVAIPFHDSQESLYARHALEEKYMKPRQAVAAITG